MNLIDLLLLLAVFILVVILIVAVVTAGTGPLKSHWRECDAFERAKKSVPANIPSPALYTRGANPVVQQKKQEVIAASSSTCAGCSTTPSPATTHVGGMPIEKYTEYLAQQAELSKLRALPSVSAPPMPNFPPSLDVNSPTPIKEEACAPCKSTPARNDDGPLPEFEEKSDGMGPDYGDIVLNTEEIEEQTSTLYKLRDDCPTTQNERDGRQLFMSHPQRTRIRLHAEGGFIVQSQDSNVWRWVKNINIGGKQIGYNRDGFFVIGGNRSRRIFYTTKSGQNFSMKIK